MAKLTESEIARGANSSSFEKGYNYYHNGYVLEITQRGEQITAKIEGRLHERRHTTTNKNGTQIYLIYLIRVIR